MVIKTSIEFFRQIHPMFEKQFDTGLHNLLWQYIVNEVRGDKIVCFHPVIAPEGRWALGVVAFNESGYYPTHVEFNDADYDMATEICDELNKELFGLLPQMTQLMVAMSMRKSETVS